MKEDERSKIKNDNHNAGATINQKRQSKTVGKFSSVSVATTTEAEEAELESRELGANYDANASVIEML